MSDNADISSLSFSDEFPVSHALGMELTAQYEAFLAGMLHPQLPKQIANLEMLNNMLFRTVKAIRDLEVRLQALEPNQR
ncbi:hypothetical protein ACF1AJ_06275 [Leifsonia sp. NPDC014704]|uniref:hypothetical protein n=1 Tax=Leifsonia sp. NPDC014704 TaxID=3364123 RepID=UPI0036F4636C